MKNIIGITMGDPKGIGPEIIAKAWQKLSDDERAQFHIYGDQNILAAAEKLANSFSPPSMGGDEGEGGKYRYTPLTPTLSHKGRWGVDDSEAANMALAAINAAVKDANSGKIAAIITAPVNKHRMQTVQPDFLGHTEYLAKAANVQNPIMMFFAEGFPCVSLVTTHLAISEVSAAITKERVLVTIERTNEALKRYFARPAPKIAVLALNPHAGEGGSIGHEEREIIMPAIELAKKQGIDCNGPFSADSFFCNKLSNTTIHDPRSTIHGIIAMYHDQGLIPIKLKNSDGCTNITLGLPYIRTSPGHGTAEDIAWQGKANAENMLATMHLTLKIAGAVSRSVTY